MFIFMFVHGVDGHTWFLPLKLMMIENSFIAPSLYLFVCHIFWRWLTFCWIENFFPMEQYKLFFVSMSINNIFFCDILNKTEWTPTSMVCCCIPTCIIFYGTVFLFDNQMKILFTQLKIMD